MDLYGGKWPSEAKKKLVAQYLNEKRNKKKQVKKGITDDLK